MNHMLNSKCPSLSQALEIKGKFMKTAVKIKNVSKTGSHYVTQTQEELTMILLSQPPEF